MELLPYEQGSLDSLCGIYCIMNALKFMEVIDEADDVKLFREILKFIEKKKLLSSVCIDGIFCTNLESILKAIIEPLYGIKSRRPFRKAKIITLDELWTELQFFLGQRNNRSIIIGLETYGWDHWSVISHISQRQLFLFDSSSMKLLPRRRCSIDKLTPERPYYLDPKEIFFLDKS